MTLLRIPFLPLFSRSISLPVEYPLYGAVDAAMGDEEDGLAVREEALLGDLVHEHDVGRHQHLSPVGGPRGGPLEHHPLRELRERPHHGVEEVGRDVDPHRKPHREDDQSVVGPLDECCKILQNGNGMLAIPWQADFYQRVHRWSTD